LPEAKKNTVNLG